MVVHLEFEFSFQFGEINKVGYISFLSVIIHFRFAFAMNLSFASVFQFG